MKRSLSSKQCNIVKDEEFVKVYWKECLPRLVAGWFSFGWFFYHNFVLEIGTKIKWKSTWQEQMHKKFLFLAFSMRIIESILRHYWINLWGKNVLSIFFAWKPF